MSKEEFQEKDIWKRKHGLYRCGNCGKPLLLYKDISEMSCCYECMHEMKGYEDEKGKVQPVRFGHQKENDIFVPMKYTY